MLQGKYDPQKKSELAELLKVTIKVSIYCGLSYYIVFAL